MRHIDYVSAGIPLIIFIVVKDGRVGESSSYIYTWELACHGPSDYVFCTEVIGIIITVYTTSVNR